MLPLGLSFQQAPPPSIPLRFFVTAPLFLLAAAVLLTWEGPQVLAVRNGPVALALTHLITLGGSTMVMCGALLQLMPVATGLQWPFPRQLATLVHVGLTLGALLLPLAFLWHQRAVMALAVLSLGIALGTFVLAFLARFRRFPLPPPSLHTQRLALLALGVTLTLGVTLGLARYEPLSIPYQHLAALHPLWGLLGWTGLLIAGVAYLLVPMFYLTPAYPKPFTAGFATIVFGLLTLRTFATDAAPFTDSALGLSALLFAGITWQRLLARKRQVADVSRPFWHLGLAALMVAGMLGCLLPWTSPATTEVLAGMLGMALLPGFILTLINGMAYKIVPFLVWFHLQSAHPRLGVVPNVRQIQSGLHGKAQMALHGVTCCLLLAACWEPALMRSAGLLWALDALWFEVNMLRMAGLVIRIHRVARMHAAV